MSNPSYFKDDLIQAYNRQADQRDASSRQPWKINERDEFLQTIQRNGAESILEIGCGPGHDSKFFQDNGLKVTCVDLSPKMIDLCKEKGLNAQVMDLTHLTFHDSSFDSIWSLNSFLHVPKTELPNVFTDICRILKPGGLFYLGVYGGRNSEGVRENDHCEPKRFFSFFEDDALKSLLSEYFTVLSFKTLPHSDALNIQSVVLRNDR